LLVEDIVDSGLTLFYLAKTLKSRKPASLQICSLLRKKGKQRLPIKVKYQGFSIDNKFVVGYGLDYHQRFRQLNSIHLLKNPPENNGY
jgi:hypoxanthine phosphoribosyltransferase